MVKQLSPRARLIFLPLVVFAVFLAYGKSLGGGFVFDDHHFVENNSAIKSLRNAFRFFYDPATLSDSAGLNSDGYRPLATLSYAVDYALAGPNPGYFRVVNLLLHCCNALLVFYLGRLLGFAGIYAGLMSAWFALFPANVEAVVWISSRSTVLSTALILSALICFIKRVERDKTKYLPPAALFTAAALFTREIAVVIPLLAIAYLTAGRGRVKKHLGAAGLYLALPAVLFVILRSLLLGRFGQASPPDLPLPAFISLPFLLFAKYLDILLYPFSMLITYSDLIHLRLSLFWLYFPLAVALFVMYAGLTALLRARGEKTAALGLLWIWIAFLPVLNIVPLTFYMAERLVYLPLIGFAMAVAAAARYINERYRLRALLWTVCAVPLALFAVNIQGRLPVWRSDTSLWQYDAEKNPGNFITRLRLAEALRSEGNLSGAYSALSAARGLASDDGQRAMICNELGTLYAVNNELEKAKSLFQASVKLDPAGYLAFYNLARVSALQRDIAAARKYLARSLALNGGYAPAAALAASLQGGAPSGKPAGAKPAVK